MIGGCYFIDKFIFNYVEMNDVINIGGGLSLKLILF